MGAGERVGIVGPSGSGKSTIVRLLSRLHQAQTGSIRVGGVDLMDIDPAQIVYAVRWLSTLNDPARSMVAPVP